MSWNIFKRVKELEVRVLVAESNVRYLDGDLRELARKVRYLEASKFVQSAEATMAKNEEEVKKRLKRAAYGRAYYKMKKEIAAKKDGNETE